MKGSIEMKHTTSIAMVLTASMTGTLIVSAFAEEDAKSVIAAQVRAQKHPCGTAENATRDKRLSKPDSAVWILVCDNATYRVRLHPDMAAEVMKLD